MDPKNEHPMKIAETVMAKRYDCLQKLNNGTKKVHEKKLK